jgi:hypothetical protein
MVVAAVETEDFIVVETDETVEDLTATKTVLESDPVICPSHCDTRRHAGLNR